MKRKFNITMHVPLGNRNGTMCFDEEGNKINGILDVLGNKDSFVGTITKSGFIQLSGKMTSVLHSFPYKAEGTIINSNIRLDVMAQRYSFYITGEEVSI